ncbi:bifunctional UDP-N-acetylglucosamine diphosphorylase/glucosamine-1-phosphate N-acetyltransferase GlmU [Luteimicrobium subarcticum]|uniref:bifunctional UDP-N-acetylglucosamine diphosphorylase/glucosamine-1-phosphate N-acetyltransferase GlmU n=1 Tax=Luteimicrobium subarcticum TaxID=620910 RepID=UPI002481BAA5|nr:bifunctional UDP-N-acetylglucosamine diphosphorylase/glucosamine-1-phosphate N-acetyltransferase GlmU [Luteimicrobium subarcticum]
MTQTSETTATGTTADGTDESGAPSLAAVVVLAAGQGTRMRSTTPKMLHEVGGRSLLGHVLTATTSLDARRTAVVVRHQAAVVAEHARGFLPDALIAEQGDVMGTGSAVRAALSVLDAAAHAEQAARGVVPNGHEGQVLDDGVDGAVLVVAGDLPLLDGGTLTQLVAAHTADGNAVTVLTTVLDDATGYGRVVREPGTGDVLRIVEHRDASEDERAIGEINSSVYVFDAAVLRRGLAAITTDNAQGELYLTDVVAHARSGGGTVRAVIVDDPSTVEGVNDRAQLAVLGAELNRRTLERWMADGVTVVDPRTTWVDVDVELAEDVTILPGTQLHGATTVARGATVGPDTTLRDVEVGEDASVVRTHALLSVIGARASVGPFAYLRPGSVLGEGGKIGTFVETKNADIGAGAKVPHLSYVGDATIGEETNIGAASVFVNYDGVRKQRSTIGAHARTGADNLFVAPVHVGDGAYTAAGSVIRQDVPAGALGVSAGAQRNIEGWVQRRRPGTAAAEAAARAAGGAARAAETEPADGAPRASVATGTLPALGAQAMRELDRHAVAAQTPPPTSPHSEALREEITTRTEGGTDR